MFSLKWRLFHPYTLVSSLTLFKTGHVSYPPPRREDFRYKWVSLSLEPTTHDTIVRSSICGSTRGNIFHWDFSLWANTFWETHYIFILNIKMIEVWDLSIINAQISIFLINVRFPKLYFLNNISNSHLLFSTTLTFICFSLIFIRYKNRMNIFIKPNILELWEEKCIILVKSSSYCFFFLQIIQNIPNESDDTIMHFQKYECDGFIFFSKNTTDTTLWETASRIGYRIYFQN